MDKNYRIEKDFTSNGFRCVITGSYAGHRCGYIGIPKGNEFYEVEYNDIHSRIDLDVHGGLTYSASGNYPVESEGIWWIGFDCAHYRDGKDYELMASFDDKERFRRLMEDEKEFSTDGEVRSMEYVKRELIRTTRQLSAK